MGGIGACLAEHAFEHLFIECLGWDRKHPVASNRQRNRKATAKGKSPTQPQAPQPLNLIPLAEAGFSDSKRATGIGWLN